MGDDTNVSVIILYSFVFIFIVFLFLQQGNLIKETGTTGYALINLDSINNLEEFSLTTLIIIITVVILLIIAGFILYKKLKRKKHDIEGAKNLSDKSLPELSKEFNMPQNKNDSSELNTDLNKLFMEEIPSPEEKTQNPEMIKEEIKEENKFNTDELKKIIKGLMKKNYTKESIVKYLNSKGYNLTQIRQAINSINENNLKSYISNALSQGFNKEDIMNALLKSGWSKEDILKHMQ